MRLALAASVLICLLLPAAATAELTPHDCVPALRLQSGWCGDGGRADRALLFAPRSVSSYADGSFVVMDTGVTGSRERFAVVRRVTADGVIVAAAGAGEAGSTGDGGPATAARISPGVVAALPDGGFLLVEPESHRVRRVRPDGIISTVAGTGARGFGGDGGPATAALLRNPQGVAVTADGGFLIADTGNSRIRRVAPDGVITTVAGDGRRGTEGDWGPASLAALDRPTDVAAIPGGGFAFVDAGSGLIRVVLPDGTIFTHYEFADFFLTLCGCTYRDPAIDAAADGSLLAAASQSVMRLGRDRSVTAVAGGPRCGYGGDGRRAVRAEFAGIADVDDMPGGGFVVADSENSRVRLVDARGIVTTVAGGGGLRAPRKPFAAAAAGPRCVAAVRESSYDEWGGFEVLAMPRMRNPVRVTISTGRRTDVTVTIVKRGRRVGRPRRLVAEREREHEIARKLRPGQYVLKVLAERDGHPSLHRRVKITVTKG
jgi:hypothetical protein